MDAGHAAGGAFLALMLVGLAMTGVWIWSLVHCATNKRLSDSNRTVGIIVIAILGLLGSLIYLFLPREAGRSRYGSRSTSRFRSRGQTTRGTRSFGTPTRSVARSRR